MPRPVPRERADARERKLADVINQGPGQYGLRIVLEAHARDIPVSVLCAVVEQESGFRNVFGHDPVKWPQIRGGNVTKARYLRYKLLRKRGFGMQGVGPMQLTWWEHQDDADRSGGCHQPHANIATGALLLHELYRRWGSWARAFEAYNAGKPGTAAGAAYSARVQQRQRTWHERLT